MSTIARMQFRRESFRNEIAKSTSQIWMKNDLYIDICIVHVPGSINE